LRLLGELDWVDSANPITTYSMICPERKGELRGSGWHRALSIFSCLGKLVYPTFNVIVTVFGGIWISTLLEHYATRRIGRHAADDGVHLLIVLVRYLCDMALTLFHAVC
jgi:hypothetical protein